MEAGLLDQRIDALIDLVELVCGDVLPDKGDDGLRRGYRVLEQLPQRQSLPGVQSSGTAISIVMIFPYPKAAGRTGIVRVPTDGSGQHRREGPVIGRRS